MPVYSVCMRIAVWLQPTNIMLMYTDAMPACSRCKYHSTAERVHSLGLPHRPCRKPRKYLCVYTLDNARPGMARKKAPVNISNRLRPPYHGNRRMRWTL